MSKLNTERNKFAIKLYKRLKTFWLTADWETLVKDDRVVLLSSISSPDTESSDFTSTISNFIFKRMCKYSWIWIFFSRIKYIFTYLRAKLWLQQIQYVWWANDTTPCVLVFALIEFCLLKHVVYLFRGDIDYYFRMNKTFIFQNWKELVQKTLSKISFFK